MIGIAPDGSSVSVIGIGRLSSSSGPSKRRRMHCSTGLAKPWAAAGAEWVGMPVLPVAAGREGDHISREQWERNYMAELTIYIGK